MRTTSEKTFLETFEVLSVDMINMITYATKLLMRIVWLMLALLGGISGRYLLVDIQEETGADGGAFPDGMD